MGDNQSTRRLNRLLWILLVWAAVIFGRLFSLQVIHHDDLARLAAQQQQKTKAIPAVRGSILDRAGQPLAKSLPAESVCVNPQRLPDRGVAADMLAGVLKMDRVALLEKIETAYLRGSGFLWIKRKIDADEAARLRSMKLDWIEFRPEMRRFYPHHSLASHVVGSIGILSAEDTEERGTAGVEASFEDDLAGTPGLAQVFTDVKQTAYDSVIARKPEPGADIMLTIDSNLQYNAEKDLARAIETSGAKTGSIVVMNPYTGEVLAIGELSRLRSEQSSRRHRAGRRAQQSRDHDAVRAGQRLQDRHDYSGTRNAACAPAAGNRHQLWKRRVQPVRPDHS